MYDCEVRRFCFSARRKLGRPNVIMLDERAIAENTILDLVNLALLMSLNIKDLV